MERGENVHMARIDKEKYKNNQVVAYEFDERREKIRLLSTQILHCTVIIEWNSTKKLVSMINEFK